MEHLKDFDRVLAEVLLEAVQRREFNVTYKEVAERIEKRLDQTVNSHFGLSRPLGTVSSICHDLGLPLISAMVRYSGATSASSVGEGFYPFACELKPEYKTISPTAAWKNELQLIRECREWGRLRLYLDGLDPSRVKAPAKTNINNSSSPFSGWLAASTKLSESSISKYSSAVGTISREMLEQGVISKPLLNMTAFELDIAVHNISSNDYFIDKNLRGNHMYSNALKQYRYFINSTTLEETEPEAVTAVRKDSSISVTERTAIVQSRIGQGIFRKSLIEKYSGRCIITGIDHEKLLVASHIKPWAVSTNQERLSVDNGLLLSATYDRLFDAGLITFNKSGQIFLSSFIGAENIKRLSLSKDMCFDLHMSSAMGEFLEYHSDKLFVK